MSFQRKDPPDFGDAALESRGPVIIGITAAFTGLAGVLVLARMYVRAFMLRTLGTDDWIIMIAMVCKLEL